MITMRQLSREALHPVSAVMHGCGPNLTVMSYRGGLDFGIVAGRDLLAAPVPATPEPVPARPTRELEIA